MFTISDTHLRSSLGRFLRIFVLCVLLTGAVSGQAKQTQRDKPTYPADKATVAAAIAAVKSGNFAPFDVEVIARADPVEAIPVLKDQFPHIQDPLLKGKIASTLVTLGYKDGVYWDYLVKQATEAVESEAPDPTSYDSTGKPLPGVSPRFEVWVKQHKVDPDRFSTLSLSLRVMDLGVTGDPRAVPVLRKGLLSPNFMVEFMSAKGLAQIGDESSVPFIVDACKRAPADMASGIASSLVYFDDPEAQAAADRYMPKHAVEDEREARAHGRKPFGD